ncbi:uncharacterized protein LOC128470257 [Spea bombifrons]|uniref:uncharacterized protein LOC128470257 n=1 Tax=Spea bombifrons TaxID=233779 RepID=UPI002349F3DB|nr:uncharacterized protein LOC128470257 [Spea bombifrons]
MATSKAHATWADLQESLNRVRQQYGLLPRAGWESLIEMTAYEKAILAKQRAKKKTKLLLPSISDDDSSSTIHTRRGSKQYDRSEKHHDIYKTHSVKKTEQRGKAKTKLENGVFKYYTENHLFAVDFVNSFVSEMLLSEIIPDVLIEALAETTTKIWLQSKKSNKKTRSREERTNSIHESCSLSILKELVAEVVGDLSTHVVRSTIKEFVDDHLLRTAVYDFMDEICYNIIQTETPLLVKEIKDEMHIDGMLQYLIDSVIEKEVKDIISTVFNEYEAQLSELQHNQISRSAGKYLIDVFFLEHLIEMTRTQEVSGFGKDSSLILLDSIMLDTLISQHLQIQHGQQSTLENHPVMVLHQKAFSKVALEVMLTELNLMLDEDMEDIFEYERDLEL